MNEDNQHGSMSPPVKATAELLKAVSVTRRIPVCQEKDSGLTTVRTVDHATGSGSKAPTSAAETMPAKGAEVATNICVFPMTPGHKTLAAKRNVKRVCRQLPLSSMVSKVYERSSFKAQGEDQGQAQQAAFI